jgi:azurin
MRPSDTMIRCSTLVILAALGCGDKHEAAPPMQAAPAPTAETKAPAAPPVAPAPAPTEPAKPDAAGVVHLTGNDQMRYNASRIEVKAGQKFKVELKNVGALPKDVMGHSFVLLKPGSDGPALAAKAMTAKATDYFPTEGAEQMLAHTKLLGPGESDTIELELAAGTYPYLCTFPGHVGLMNGQLVAQ